MTGIAIRIALVMTASVAMLTTIASPSSAYSYPSNVVTACTSGYAFNGTTPIVFVANRQATPCITDTADVTIPQVLTVRVNPFIIFEIDTVLVHADTTATCSGFAANCLPAALATASAHEIVIKLNGAVISRITGLVSHAGAFDHTDHSACEASALGSLGFDSSTGVGNVNLLGVNLGGGSPIPLAIPGGGTIRTNIITTQTAADGSSTFTDAAPVIVTLPGQAPIEFGASHVAMACVLGN